MSLSLVPEITQVGLQAVWNTTNTGISAEISHIGLGDAGYVPSKAQTALQSEKRRIPVAGGEQAGPQQIHVTGIEDGADEYWIREVGFYLSDGTLFAVWSSTDGPLAYKAGGVDLVVAFDLALSALPADSITVSTTGSLNLFLAGELTRLATAIIANQAREMRNFFAIHEGQKRTTSLEEAMLSLRSRLNV